MLTRQMLMMRRFSTATYGNVSLNIFQKNLIFIYNRELDSSEWEIWVFQWPETLLKMDS